jgi:putative intracellular protease/amidase/Flp pilus assembly protein TadD
MRRIDAALKLFLSLVLACGLAARASEVRADGKKPSGRRNVAIVVYDGVELLDFAGPGEVFASAGDFRVFTVGPSHAPVLSQGFVRITPDYSVEDSPAPDIVVVPGGNAGSFSGNAAGMAWMRKVAPAAEVAMSVCTGAFILGRVGLLDGKAATTHWSAIDTLRKSFPKTEVKTGVRYVDTGQVLTTAGVSAGIDGALHLVQRLLGDEVAWQTARYMQYDAWEPKQSGSLTPKAKEALRALVFRDGDRANQLLSEQVAASPKDPVLVSRLGRAQLLKGSTKEGISTLQQAVTLGDRSPLTLRALANAQLSSGDYRGASRTFQQLVDERGSENDAYNLACARARGGDSEGALAALEQAVKLGFRNRTLAENDDDLRSIRGDPRFAKAFDASEAHAQR